MKAGDEWLGPALAAAGSIKALKSAGKSAAESGGQGALEALLLASFLSAEQQRLLDRYAPSSLQTPGGTRARLIYPLEAAEGSGVQAQGDQGNEVAWSPGGSAVGAGLAPVLESKLQEWFGATESPCIGPHGQVRVKLSLLSPAGRQVALTQDLPFFWANGYVSIRAELRARYSKHPWPEDPLAASPTRETNKALRAATQAGQEDSSGKGGGVKGKRGKGKRRK